MTESPNLNPQREARRDLFADLIPPLPPLPRAPQGGLNRIGGWIAWGLALLVAVLVVAAVVGALIVLGVYFVHAWPYLACPRRFSEEILLGMVSAIALLLYGFILHDFARCIREQSGNGKQFVDVALRAFVLGFVALLPTIEGLRATPPQWHFSALGIGGVVVLLALLRYIIMR